MHETIPVKETCLKIFEWCNGVEGSFQNFIGVSRQGQYVLRVKENQLKTVNIDSDG